MKKILFIGMSPSFGGINTFILNMFLTLKDEYRCEFLNTFNQPLIYSKVIERNGGIIKHLNIPHNKLKYFVRYYLAKKFFKSNHDYDLVDLNATTINKIFWIKAAKKYGINNFIMHAHIDSYNKPYLLKQLSKPLTKHNEKYLSNHKIIEWAASSKCGSWMFHNSNFRVINNGVDVQLFVHNEHKRNVIRQRMGIKSTDKVIITTSRLEYEKNYPKIIKTFYGIRKKFKSAKLVIIGSGSMLNKIKSMIKDYQLSNCTYLLGTQSIKSISNYLNIADMMLMPSFYEGMPFSLIEAQAGGVPALVSTHIPKRANVTGKINFLSLNDTDSKWAQISDKILYNSFNNNQKLKMNNNVKKSIFNLENSMKIVKYTCNKIMNK